MIVDPSALVAIVLREPEHERLIRALTTSQTRPGIGAPSAAELGVVLSARLNCDSRGLIDGLFDQLDVEVVDFTEAHWRVAIGAYQRFGRGRHTAGLNFGDCLTYALADLAGQPLLFVGDDFSHTDLAVAPY